MNQQDDDNQLAKEVVIVPACTVGMRGKPPAQ